MLFHAYGKLLNWGPNGFVAKVGKDAKLSKTFENVPSNTQEQPLEDGKNLGVVINFINFKHCYFTLDRIPHNYLKL